MHPEPHPAPIPPDESDEDLYAQPVQILMQRAEGLAGQPMTS